LHESAAQKTGEFLTLFHRNLGVVREDLIERGVVGTRTGDDNRSKSVVLVERQRKSLGVNALNRQNVFDSFSFSCAGY
jgi:hypothetical protein